MRVEGLEQICREHGLRMTRQRRAILRVLEGAADHPDASEILRRVRNVEKDISGGTIYRTLALLEVRGILRRHSFGVRRARAVEIRAGDHHHLIDATSGKVIEFEDAEITRLHQRVASSLGYRLVGHRVELYGVASGGEDE